MMVFDDVQFSLQNGVTVLHVASGNGHVEVVNILLQNGAHVDVQDEVSFTFSDRAVELKAVYVSRLDMSSFGRMFIFGRTSGLL